MQREGVETTDPLADIVRRERLRREWSVRSAATAGGISNTYWGGFEDYKQPLTPTIVEAVARAFNWSRNWPIEKSQTQTHGPIGWGELPALVQSHGEAIEELRDHVEMLIQGLLQRVEDVERRLPTNTRGRQGS